MYYVTVCVYVLCVCLYVCMHVCMYVMCLYGFCSSLLSGYTAVTPWNIANLLGFMIVYQLAAEINVIPSCCHAKVKDDIVVLKRLHQNKVPLRYYCIYMWCTQTAIFNSKNCYVAHALFNYNVQMHCSTKLITVVIQFCFN